MTTSAASFGRDANSYPITRYGLVVPKSLKFSGNTTQTNALFTVTGTVEVVALYGQVTTTLGSNVTAAYWRLNDGSNQSNITLNTGTTLSSAGVGSLIVKKDLASAALSLINNSQETVNEPTTLETMYFSPCVVTSKISTTTNIEFVYTTNNSSAGAITFYCGFIPVSSDGNITAL